MNYSFKNNLISLMICCCLFVVSMGIFMAFVNSKAATSSDIDTSTKSTSTDLESTYYKIVDGNISEVKDKPASDVGNNFAGIIVTGSIKDDMGMLDFTMERANIKAKYRQTEDEGNEKTYFSYNEMSYDPNNMFRVDGDTGSDAMFQGYVYYNNDEDKEICKHLNSDAYFSMVSCEDERYLYTTIDTASVSRNESINSIKNNAIYSFDKQKHETNRICDINIHEKNEYIYDIGCNDKYIYVLISKSNELYTKVYSKDSGSEVSETKVEIKANVNEFATKLVQSYDVRNIADYEVIEDGYEFFVSDKGLVIINKKTVAEIEKTSGKHYGEKGYVNAFDAKGLEPYVKELYIVSSYSVDGRDVKYDNSYMTEGYDMYDFAYYKDGITYVLSNENDPNAEVIEKIRVTAMKEGQLLDQIYINLNKISDTSGSKELLYIGVE